MTIPPDSDASGEPDDMNDADLAKARANDDTSTANGMARASNLASGMAAKLKMSRLGRPVDHPYGDGTHGTAGGDPLARLGAGIGYGE